MYNLINLTLKNINNFRQLNQFSSSFSLSNEDFFQQYDSSNIIQKMLLRKNVILLTKETQNKEDREKKSASNYVGYIWFEKHNKRHSSIKSINVSQGNDFVNCYKILISSLVNSNLITYECEGNEVNVDILYKIGFKRISGLMELEKQCNEYKDATIAEEITFSMVEKNKDENQRCLLQNEIFQNNDRIPINIEDIYYDEAQGYYFDKGAVFIKRCGIPIGYGQIIVEDNVATIVNFGIKGKYRKEGYGKVLLSYLLNVAMDNNFNKVGLKVDANNIPALNLYLSLGFNIKREVYTFEKTKIL